MLKKGDIVGRISYNKDVIFEITKIIKTSNNVICILKGITERIEADSPIEDLEIIDKRTANSRIKKIEDKMEERIKRCANKKSCLEELKQILEVANIDKRSIKNVYMGKILHLDGDRRYAEKSMKYYKSLGLNAVVKNIPESRQASSVRVLLNKYKPDILVLTGHDGMIKKGTAFNDIYNYRNSKYFIETVNEARKWNDAKSQNLVIFAGACQSYYEAIISAGANFASSPKRIMIDFIDPLIVAERIATTENTKYLTIKDIEDELRDGKDGINGIGAMGKKQTVIV